MEDNFKQNDFEEFLQDQVRNHRMYPADAVWREIDKKLHGDKRWPALTIAALTLLSATVLICVYFTPKPNIFAIPPANVSTSTHQTSANNNILSNLTPATPFIDKASRPVAVTSAVSPLVTDKTPTVAAVPKANFSLTTASATEAVNAPTASHAPVAINNSPAAKPTVTAALARQAGKVDLTPINIAIENSRPLALNNTKPVAGKTKAVDETATKDYNDRNAVDDFLKEHKSDVALHTSNKKTNLKNRFSYQLYVAPSVSYRKLIEDNSIEKATTGGPVGLNYVTDVNKVVRHKPGTGIELGVSFMYNLSKSVRVKSGVQFNMRQYSIEAYRSSTELVSIALLTGNRIDTIVTLSNYRNNNGYSSAELVNRYYQISMPLGVEWEVVGNKKLQLNVAGTIQPTYLLNRNAYLLSTNFKNYTENPGMVRQWNLNSNIEAFVSFKVGDFKWQLGPQLRYQPYSTFIPQYTIKEHLMDYGIKLGVSHLIK